MNPLPDASQVSSAKPSSLRGVAMRVWRVYLTPYLWPMVFATLAGVVVAATTGAAAFIMKPAADQLFSSHPPALGWIYFPAMIIGLAIVRGVATVSQTWTTNTVGHKIVGRMQVDLFGRIIRSDLAKLRSAHSGSVVSSMLYDAALVRNAATSAAVNYVREALTVIGVLVVMFVRDWALTLGVLLAGPIIIAVIQRFTRWIKKAAKGAMSETAGLSSAIMEGIDGVKIVKIDNREAFEDGRVEAAVLRRQAFIIKGSNIGAALAPILEIVMSFVLGGVLAYVAWQHAHGHTTVGDFISFSAALAIASQSLRQVGNLQSAFTEGFTAAERMFAVMDVEAEVADAPGAVALSEPAHGVALARVAFAYNGQDDVALDGITLKADRGETIALVGPSGGGKSTILNLIPRFYDVTGGAITIDGHDVRGLTLASLRDQIALVTQEPFLFDDTIAANIAYARPGASQAEIEAAAREAAAHDFITSFPAGYNTPVGEAGARLSGGQRQRIAIARAFLKNAPILLLDEATSALDTESEAQVQAALERLMAGRATILIAHRLSTVKGADRIYVIDRGRVVETGTHAGLIRAGGLYARLARSQDLEPAPEAAE